MFSSMKFGIGTAVIMAAAFGFGGQAYAQSASAHQDFNAHTKQCVDLGILGHACTPDVHIAGTAYEEVEFAPNPQAKVRLKVTSPFSFDTGFQGIDSSGCQPVPGVSYYGEGVLYCTNISDINMSGDQIKFNIAQSIKMTIGIPHVKEWSVEVPLWHRAVDVRK